MTQTVNALNLLENLVKAPKAISQIKGTIAEYDACGKHNSSTIIPPNFGAIAGMLRSIKPSSRQIAF